MSDTVSFQVNGHTVTMPEAEMQKYAAAGIAAQAAAAAKKTDSKVASTADVASTGGPNGNAVQVPVNDFNSGGSVDSPTSTASTTLEPLDLKTKVDSASGTPIGGAADASGTPYDGSTGPIGAATAGASDPTITVANNSSTRRYYKIEASAGSDPESLNNNIFYLDPGQKATINTGAGFNGAVTDQGSTTNAANAGTRQEINFSQPGVTWYDADLERGGATNSTLGPTDTSMLANGGRSSLVGNQYAYLTAGAVAGQTENAQNEADDLKNRDINTQKMTITSS